MSVKSWLRKWLEIPPPAPPLERQIDRAFGKIGGISRDQAQMESDLRNAATDAENALHQAHELQRKFDALAAALGVYVIANVDGEATIASTRENGLMGTAERYIEAALLAQNFMNPERRVLDQRRELLQKFSAEFNHLPAAKQRGSA